MNKITKLLVLALMLTTLAPVMAKKLVESGDSVSVIYTGRLADGRVFDSNVGKDPLTFTAGAGQMIKGFDAGIIGMVKKEKKTITIPSAEAYGLIDQTKVFEIPKTQLPAGVEAELGSKLTMQTAGGAVVVKVVKVTEKSVFIDANHMLAGKDLIFDIELVKIEKAKKVKAKN